MKYLTIAPDYTGFGIKDEFGKSSNSIELELPEWFLEEINAWHEAYKMIIPLSNQERNSKMAYIEKLDNQGLIFAEKLKHLVPGGAKVKYFSEGKIKIFNGELTV